MNEDTPYWPQAPEREQQPEKQQRHERSHVQAPEWHAPAPFTATEDERPLSLLFPADRVYVPFELRARPESLIFLSATMPAQGAAYHELSHYLFDQHYGQYLTLFYPRVRVHVTGQRLAPVIQAVVCYRCAILREWHKNVYDAPGRGIAVIESIDITLIE